MIRISVICEDLLVLCDFDRICYKFAVIPIKFKLAVQNCQKPMRACGREKS